VQFEGEPEIAARDLLVRILDGGSLVEAKLKLE
jgi:hypothetical protein